MRPSSRVFLTARTAHSVQPRVAPRTSIPCIAVAALPRPALLSLRAPARVLPIPTMPPTAETTPSPGTAMQAMEMGEMRVLDARPDGTKFAEIKFPGGELYIGEVNLEKQRHGSGAYWYPSGAQYIGDFQRDAFYGKGEFKGANGDSYDGDWRDGKQHGYGVYIPKNGGKYDGEWERGMRHGTGTYYYPDGIRIYRGEWKDNMKHGRGTFTYENGDKYDGDWQNNKQHGQGTMLLKNGNLHQADWKDGKPTGPGRLITSDGQVLETETNARTGEVIAPNSR